MLAILDMHSLLLYPLNHAVPTEPRELTVMYLNSTELEITWQNPLCDYGVRRGYNVSLHATLLVNRFE